MGLTSVKKIYLDFYNTNIVTINAKQGDDSSRYVDITCTEYGKKKVLSPSKEIIFVEGKRPDDTNVFVRATITENGTALIDLTEMLVVDGKCIVDLMVVSNENSKIADVSGAEDLYNLKPSIITTMSFSINVIPSTISYARLASSDTYTAFADTLKNIAVIETMENERQEAEAERVVAENLRVINNSMALQACNEATNKANQVANKLNDVNNALAECENVTQYADKAALKAEAAANYIADITETRDASVFYSTITGTDYTFQIPRNTIFTVANMESAPVTGDLIIVQNNYWYCVVGENATFLYVIRLANTSSYLENAGRGSIIKYMNNAVNYGDEEIRASLVDAPNRLFKGDLIIDSYGTISLVSSSLFTSNGVDCYKVIPWLTRLGIDGNTRGQLLYLSSAETSISTSSIDYNTLSFYKNDNSIKYGDLVLTRNNDLFIVTGMGSGLYTRHLTTLS